jgi:hypothetical protein
MGDSPSEIREEIAQTRDRLAETAGAVAYKADVPTRVKDSIGGTTTRVKDRIGGVFGAAGDRASDAGSAVGDVASGARHRASSGLGSAASMARENPMGAFVGGIAAGMVLGLMIPKTKFEQQRFGDQATELMNQATERVADLGHRAMDKEKEMIQRAGDRATETVESSSSSDEETSTTSMPTTGASTNAGTV